ncbi:4-alpha-glucanotransferase [Marispirochaeta aestuarii]|uniref:4-alpha-glucanotransferase n=1 Tax=Marispirochaeta aestuarii TaxID=1963862 RepID=UPI0029C6D395|nr:4-alpha-glucanotransferase [Marispirochaeta aestuarii]
MIHRRSAGILLHPTSLSGPWGIGDLGQGAYRFVDFLTRCGMSLWQILPLGPTGFGNSPYASVSSFAGNPMLISPDILLEEGLLSPGDLEGVPDFPRDRVDYNLVVPWKTDLVRRAAGRFLSGNAGPHRKAFEDFCREESWWLDDYALYASLQDHFKDRRPRSLKKGPLINSRWDKDIALREPEALARWSAKLHGETEMRKVIQFLFYRQWRRLKSYAAEQGIRFVGDIPIFVAPDSADVWAWREYFQIDGEGRLTAQAGVPPDYFSETGQLWGNPVYNWEALGRDRYSWWIRRIEYTLKQVDWVRIDHFRGFEAYWNIPADAETAVDGKWIKAPGFEMFQELKRRLGRLPIIAEDLGVITPEVIKLRQDLEFPGMRVLQFGFEFDLQRGFNAEHHFLPHNYDTNTVVYTGTHDNDTTAGWYCSMDGRIQDIVRRYLARDDHDIVWDFIRMAMSSTAGFAVVPFQDLLSLGTEFRMNTPSTVGPQNWAYRHQPEDLNDLISARLREMNSLYGRLPKTEL